MRLGATRPTLLAGVALDRLRGPKGPPIRSPLRRMRDFSRASRGGVLSLSAPPFRQRQAKAAAPVAVDPGPPRRLRRRRRSVGQRDQARPCRTLRPAARSPPFSAGRWTGQEAGHPSRAAGRQRLPAERLGWPASRPPLCTGVHEAQIVQARKEIAKPGEVRRGAPTLCSRASESAGHGAADSDRCEPGRQERK